MSDEIFDLIYIRNDGRIYHARRLPLGWYKIREPMLPDTERKISRHELRKDFKFHDRTSNENVKRRTQPNIGLRYA